MQAHSHRIALLVATASMLTLPRFSPIRAQQGNPEPPPRGAAAPAKPLLEMGTWRAWLESPGGQLPFGLELARDTEGQLLAQLRNGSEQIAVPLIEDRAALENRLTLSFPHYDASIEATISADGSRLEGEYVKRLGPDRWRRLPFRATSPRPDSGERIPFTRFEGRTEPDGNVSGRWRIGFDSSPDSAVGILNQNEQGEVQGTILTTTGDYRFLAGSLDGKRLRLSAFDAAHSFLFDAQLQADGSLKGDFWSGDTWHESWSAVLDPEASLANPFEATHWYDLASLSDILLPDASGTLRSLTEPELRGRATLVVLFGTWCPNCHDEAPYLVELMQRYGPQGLRVVGLAFEFTGERQRDSLQLRRFAERYNIQYPLLLAGTADKADATLAFPGVDFVHSYPTTLFVDSAGRVRWIHSGFAGPATGAAYSQLRHEFEGRIEKLLEEPASNHGDLLTVLPSSAWRTDKLSGNSTIIFSSLPNERLMVQEVDASNQESVIEHEVRLVGSDAVWVGEQLFRLDPIAQVLLSPTSFGDRLMPANQMDSPLLIEAGFPGIREVPKALQHPDARVRREALWALGRRKMRAAGSSAEEFLPLIADPEVEVAIAAIWASAATGDLSCAESLAALKHNPNARVRREVARGLRRLGALQPSLLDELVTLEDDPDPLVRAIAVGQ